MRIFSGLYKGRTLLSPKGSKTRPTSGRLRETLFNICQHSVEGSSFLDLFAGTGAMGLEALSRGASSATFVDNSQESIRCIRANIESLQVQKQCELLFGDVFQVIDRLVKKEKRYDLIYADPPYEAAEEGFYFSHVLLTTLDELIGTPHSLLTENGTIFIEEAEKALSAMKPLKHLKLKSARKMGRSALQQYEKMT